MGRRAKHLCPPALAYRVPTDWSRVCSLKDKRTGRKTDAGACRKGVHCAGPGPGDVALASENVAKFAFAGITELWDLSLCLFHRLHGAWLASARVEETP